jgi:phage terminase large subunit GpA-like protein
MFNTKIDKTSKRGPVRWAFIDTAAWNYPIQPTQEDRKAMNKLIEFIKYYIPCPKCKENFTAYCDDRRALQNALNSRDDLLKWFLNLHNIKNEDD